MEYLIRFAQVHETFRRAEIEAIATVAGIDIEFLSYDKYVWRLSWLTEPGDICFIHSCSAVSISQASLACSVQTNYQVTF